MLSLIDEYTRECLTIDVARRLHRQDVLKRLCDLFVRRGVPDYIRSDNGAEFTAKAVRGWLSRIGVTTLFIESGSPGENGYIEAAGGKLNNREVFATLLGAEIAARRHCRHGQSVMPEGETSGRSHRGRWCPNVVPSALLARPQPDRPAVVKG